jgi:hypothetical protein
MIENYRNFDVNDIFGNTVAVEFRWQQNGITIRHADTVDVKFWLHQDGTHFEQVVALPHPLLLKVCAETGRILSDAWCSRIAALHVQHMIETGEDTEKNLVTLSLDEIRKYSEQVTPLVAEAAH